MADIISSELSSIFYNWNLEKPELWMVTDRGANIKKQSRNCLRSHGVSVAHVAACGEHRTGTHSQGRQWTAEVAVQSLRHCWPLRWSPLATRTLANTQQQLNLPKNIVVQDCATRWNSQVSIYTTCSRPILVQCSLHVGLMNLPMPISRAISIVSLSILLLY